LRGRRNRASQGTALLVAMAVTVVLVALALAINGKIQKAVDAGQREVARTVALNAATGALHTAMAVLAEDQRASRIDSLAEGWADAGKVSALAMAGAADGVVIRMQISDERAKIQVNALVDFPRGQQVNPAQQLLWERFLGFSAFDGLAEADMTPTMIVGALKDWLDRGDDDALTGLGGAERAYYESLPVPYRCRNGPLPAVDELRLVRGIGRPLLDGKPDQPGIGAFLTVHAMRSATAGAQPGGSYDGRINLNTAPLPVLMALLPEEYQDLAAVIDEFRRQALEDEAPEVFTDPLWYRNAPGCQSLTIDPELITTASDHFRVQAEAAFAGVRVATSAVIERRADPLKAQTGCRIVMWERS
jgi:general secretion pathway protein K